MVYKEGVTPTISNGYVAAWYEEIGPARAEQLLNTYKVDYRKYRPTYGETLARDMSSVNPETGESNWVFDGSPIRIDEEGNLFDGQHRMRATILSGQTNTFLVESGLPVRAYSTTDTGLARTYGDNLRRRGYANVSVRAALIKLIHRAETGVSFDDTKRLSNSEMDRYNDRYGDSLNRAVEKAVGMRLKMAYPLSLVAFTWWAFSQLDLEKAHTFLVSLAEGENFRRGMPVFTLRERLRKDAAIRYSRNEYMYLVSAAWDAFVNDRHLEKINFPTGFLTRDKIDRVVNYRALGDAKEVDQVSPNA